MSDAVAAAPTPGHELLLGLAGWVDDDLLAIGRELVAVGEEGGALELLVASLAAARAALPHPVRDRLADAAERRIGPDLSGLVPPGAPLPNRTAHVFAADGGAPGATARIVEVVDGLAVVARSRARTALAWRLTPAGAAPGPLPHPVVLLVLDDPAHAEVLAYQVGAALARAGVTASVETFVDSATLPPYQRAALAAARPFLAVPGDRPATTDVGGSSAGVPETDHTDVAPPTAVTVTGPHGPVREAGDDADHVAPSADEDRSDPLAPGWTPPERSAEESGAHAATAVSATAGTGPQEVVPVGDERTTDDRSDGDNRTVADDRTTDRSGDDHRADRSGDDHRITDRTDGERRSADQHDGDQHDGERRDGERRDAAQRDGEQRDGERRNGEGRDRPRTVEAAGSGSGEPATSARPAGSGPASAEDTVKTAQGPALGGSDPAGARAPGIEPSGPPPVSAGGVDPARFDPARNAVDRNVHGGRRPEIAGNPPGAKRSAGPASHAAPDSRPTATAPPTNGSTGQTTNAEPDSRPTPPAANGNTGQTSSTAPDSRPTATPPAANGNTGRTPNAEPDARPTTIPPAANGSGGQTTNAEPDSRPTATPPPTNGSTGRTPNVAPDSRPAAAGSADVRPGPATDPDPHAEANGRPAPRRNPRPAPQASVGQDPDPGTPTPGRPAGGHGTIGVDHPGEQEWARQWSDGSWSTSATPPAGPDRDIEPATSPTPTTPPLSRVPPSPARRSTDADGPATGPGGAPATPTPDARHRHRLDLPALPPEPAGGPSPDAVLDSRLTPNEQELLHRLQQELAAREGGSTDQSSPPRNGTAHPREQD